MIDITDSEWLLLAASMMILFFYFAIVALVLKFFQLVIKEPQNWAHRIMFITAAVSLIVTCTAIDIVLEEQAEIFAFVMPFILATSLRTKEYNAFGTPLDFFRRYAAEHDTPCGKFLGFIVEVWRPTTFVVVSIAVVLFYLIR